MPERIVSVGREEDVDILDMMFATEDLIRCSDCQFYSHGKNEVDEWSVCTKRVLSFDVTPDGYCAWALPKEGSGHDEIP